MRKPLIIIALLFFCLYLRAQTKEETENWIKEKFEKQNSSGGVCITPYGNKGTDGHVYDIFLKNIKIDISNGRINLSYEEKEKDNGVEMKQSSKIRLENIVVFGITSVYAAPPEIYEGNRQPQDVIVLTLNPFIAHEYHCKKVYTSADNSESSHEINIIKLPLYSGLEENFLARFKKAIEHYKTFYPQPEKKKEVF